MTEPTTLSPAAAKRRQTLLLAGIALLLIGAALLSVALTGSRESDPRAAKPKSTNILAPGAQVDPRDAWRGQADAQLKAIEQTSRAVSQRSTELEGQNKEMLERLKKLEQSGLTPLPPPPVAAPAARPDFGPDRPLSDPPRGWRCATSASPATSPTTPALRLAEHVPVAGCSARRQHTAPALGDPQHRARRTDRIRRPPRAPIRANPPARDARRYLPSGAFAKALLLGGLDAPTGGQAQRNPQPVLLRLTDHAVLPNHFRSRVKECFVVGAGFGDVSAERAYIRTESLSCVTRDGTALDVPIKGYVAGEDGKAGLRGRLVSKQGQLLANALLAGVASGIGHAFQQGSTTLSVSPLGSTGTVEPGKQFQAGMGTGVGKALDRLAQYYISLAEKVFPVIEVDAGRMVDVVVTQGVSLQGALDAEAQDREDFPAACRARTTAYEERR